MDATTTVLNLATIVFYIIYLDRIHQFIDKENVIALLTENVLT